MYTSSVAIRKINYNFGHLKIVQIISFEYNKDNFPNVSINFIKIELFR